VAASTKLPPTLQLAFDIDQGAGYQHWAYRAHCNGSATAHGIRITTVCLPRAPGDISQATRAKLLDLIAMRSTPKPDHIPVRVSSERRRQPRPRQAARQRQHSSTASANIAIRFLRLANLLPQ